MNNYDDWWKDLEKALEEVGFTTHSNSIYKDALDLTKQNKSKQPVLTYEEKLEVLRAMIDYTLDVGNKAEFEKYSTQYNELKLQLA